MISNTLQVFSPSFRNVHASGRSRRSTLRVVGVRSISSVEDVLALFEDERTLSVVDHRRREQRQAGVAVFFVVPTKKSLAERAAVLNTPEAVRELRPILHGAELTFRIRVVIRDVRTTMGFGDSQVGQ